MFMRHVRLWLRRVATAVTLLPVVLAAAVGQGVPSPVAGNLAGAMEALARKQEISVYQEGRRTRAQIAHDEVFVEVVHSLAADEAKALVDLLFPGGTLTEHKDRQLFVRLGNPWKASEALAWTEALADGKGLSAAVKVNNISPVLYPADRIRKDGTVISGGNKTACRMVIAPRITLNPPLEGGIVDFLQSLLQVPVINLADGQTVGSGFQALAIEQALNTRNGSSIAPQKLPVSVEIMIQPVPFLTPNDQFFNQQWHLLDNSSINVNVQKVWDQGIFGTGINITVDDDGLQIAHPDLDANTPVLGVNKTSASHWDYIGNDSDPYSNVDAHGTACAGIIGAGQGSNLGVSGIAPRCTLLGIRMLGGLLPDSSFNEIFQWPRVHVASNSWGYDPGVLIYTGETGLAAARTKGRNGLGKIMVFAAGNGDLQGDYVTFEGHLNDRVTIPVGAVGFDGVRAAYSERGPCLVVCGPSMGWNDFRGIVTTDLTGSDGYNVAGAPPNLSSNNYTNTFSGTSAACPMVSGVVALLLEERPDLGWRDVQEILIKTARKVDLADGGWQTNSANYTFSNQYGAGLAQALPAVQVASTWELLEDESAVVKEQTGLGLDIPDNNSTGVEVTFNVTELENQRVENVVLDVSITHGSPRDLRIELISPSGTESVLAEEGEFTGGDTSFVLGDFEAWSFRTVFNWGENSNGTWTVRVSDLSGNSTGTLNDLTLNLYGVANELIPPPTITMHNKKEKIREHEGSVEIVIEREGWKETDVTAEVFTEHGSAGTADYTPYSGSVTFNPGEKLARLQIPILDEDLPEEAENFTVRLGNLTTSSTEDNEQPVYGEHRQTEVVIQRNDFSLLKVDPADVTMNVTESQTVANVGVTREGETDSWSKVSFRGRGITATPDKDYNVPRGYVMFMPGQRLQIVPFQVVSDMLTEAREEFVIEFYDPSKEIDISVGQGNSTISIVDP